MRKERKKMEQGKIFKFHNDLDTDQIIASQYLLLPNLDEICLLYTSPSPRD